MRYFSTNRKSSHAGFKTAALRGQPSDMGLYFPEQIPKTDWNRLRTLEKEEIAFEVIRPYTGDAFDDETLFRICSETVNFDFPLVKIDQRISTLELFHGATLAFKDVGARFMSRCLQHFTKESNDRTLVIVATSGDTGGAVANGFYGVEGVDVVILFPKDKVSKIQELQLTTPGDNITAIEIDGTFDECQKLAKTALADEDLKKAFFVTSANSINIARWLPQQFYYFYALQQWNEDEPPVICVPSGNFGNICAGILAHISGLPAKKLIAATNSNDVIPRYIQSGKLEPKRSVSTLSNAMDVGDPSNFVRILEIFERDFGQLKTVLDSKSVSDGETAETIRSVYKETGYLLDPHGAVGYSVLADHLNENEGDKGFFLETAHPIKFDSVETIIGGKIDMPESVRGLFSRTGIAVEMDFDYECLKEFLLDIPGN
ncbi:MAG: threonine synthase [Pyrinomonadaceae bacterium]